MTFSLSQGNASTKDHAPFLPNAWVLGEVKKTVRSYRHPVLLSRAYTLLGVFSSMQERPLSLLRPFIKRI